MWSLRMLPIVAPQVEMIGGSFKSALKSPKKASILMLLTQISLRCSARTASEVTVQFFRTRTRSRPRKHLNNPNPSSLRGFYLPLRELSLPSLGPLLWATHLSRLLPAPQPGLRDRNHHQFALLFHTAMGASAGQRLTDSCPALCAQ